MKIAALALAFSTVVILPVGPAAATQRGSASIPPQFHGRWGASPRACRGPEHQEIIITLNRRGWSSWEEGGAVTRVGQVRGDTHYFRVHDASGAEEADGTMALRRVGNRLTMSIHEDGHTPSHYDYVLCR
jgi:hypothetical protein